MEKNRRTIVAGITVIIFFSFLGACSKGDKGSDVKQLLTKAIEGVEKLEQENRDLRSDAERQKKDGTAAENRKLKEELSKLQKENEQLKKETAASKESSAEAESQVQAGEGQRDARIAALEQENKTLQDEVSKLKGLLSFSNLQLEERKDQQERITELEKKNQELSDLLDKIHNAVQEPGGTGK